MTPHFITAKNIKTHFRIFGEGKEKLVFLHGWGGSSESFESLAPRIAKKAKMQALVVDLPGFGKSDPPPPEGWTTHEYQSWLKDFLRQQKISKASFYGHSFGCRVLVRLLVHKPELAQKVILSGAAGIRWPLSLRQKISVFLSKTFSPAKSLIPDRVQKFILCRVFGARDWGMVPAELKATLRKTLDEPDFRDELSQIKTPVLLLWGHNDQITPLRSAKVFARELPHAKLKILDGGRHGIHHTHGDKITKYVTQFLNEK
ncbi:alpha/beta hydrolase [Candidatus Gracilibacteria bacterium]|nr:alpha/beta hydrolase [Candidatus Gracilibacteria bacterium]MCF7819643.1 alpha/beta hydrolase [Candidatus Gracilibacteria bacterium]